MPLEPKKERLVEERYWEMMDEGGSVMTPSLCCALVAQFRESPNVAQHPPSPL